MNAMTYFKIDIVAYRFHSWRPFFTEARHQILSVTDMFSARGINS